MSFNNIFCINIVLLKVLYNLFWFSENSVFLEIICYSFIGRTRFLKVWWLINCRTVFIFNIGWPIVGFLWQRGQLNFNIAINLNIVHCRCTTSTRQKQWSYTAITKRNPTHLKTHQTIFFFFFTVRGNYKEIVNSSAVDVFPLPGNDLLEAAHHEVALLVNKKVHSFKILSNQKFSSKHGENW